jgi:hypothetical protein
MKKFYTLIFTGVFLLFSLSMTAQPPTTWISIATNPSNFTLDDGNFWVGGTAPPNPCTNCTIKIFANVSMVQNGNSSVPAFNTCVPTCTFLNDVVLNNSTINVYGNTILRINTYLQLFNSTITIGNDPSTAETIFVNDQVQLNGTSSVQLANSQTVVNSNNDDGNTVIGPLLLAGVIPGVAGLYSVRTPTEPSPGSTDYTLNTLTMANYNESYTLPMYLLNCTSTCANGIVFGPATTVFDATLGTAPIQGFIGFEESTTLPVVLVQFLATRNDDGTVKVSWATSQEQNSSYYDVERSSDQAAWAKIGTVQAKGYASTTSNYSLIDNLPIKGTGYYRLKMVDLDGKFVYSKAIAVTSSSSNVPLVIYNNPFTDQIRLKVNVSMAQNLNLTVTNMLGQIYISQTYQAMAGDNYINMLPGAGGNGMYVLHIHGDSYDQTVKLEKQ